MAYTLAVIGGSGLYELKGLTNIESLNVVTPFGAPSSPVVRGRLATRRCCSCPPRIGSHDSATPDQLPSQHLRLEVEWGDACDGHQCRGVDEGGDRSRRFGDRRPVYRSDRKRASTFFEDGIAAHVSFADPICPKMAEAVEQAARSTGARVHRGGNVRVHGGTQFSTKAESQVYRSWGVSVIGMTNMPEAKLAREAELPFATLALATDYDCWHQSERAVSVDQVSRFFNRMSSGRGRWWRRCHPDSRILRRVQRTGLSRTLFYLLMPTSTGLCVSGWAGSSTSTWSGEAFLPIRRLR